MAWPNYTPHPSHRKLPFPPGGKIPHQAGSLLVRATRVWFRPHSSPGPGAQVMFCLADLHWDWVESIQCNEGEQCGWSHSWSVTGWRSERQTSKPWAHPEFLQIEPGRHRAAQRMCRSVHLRICRCSSEGFRDGVLQILQPQLSEEGPDNDHRCLKYSSALEVRAAREACPVAPWQASLLPLSSS